MMEIQYILIQIIVCNMILCVIDNTIVVLMFTTSIEFLRLIMPIFEASQFQLCFSAD